MKHVTRSGPWSSHPGSLWLCWYRSLALLLAAAAAMLTGCAGSGGQGSKKTARGLDITAPVELVRTLDSGFLQNPKYPGLPVPGWLNPVSLAVAANGHLVVADKGTGQITKTDARGNLLGAVAYFDPRGLSNNRAPRFVRMDYSGNVYVTDAMNAQVVIYDARLRPVSTLVPPYDALDMAEGSISGVAIGSYGEFYMADLFNGRVFRFDASGRYMAVFPSPDDPAPPLNRPMGLACSDQDGSVYVCESGTAQITVFDNLGSQVRTFGGSDLKDPVAIALDKQGRCFVADTELDAVVMFDRTGHFLGRLDTKRIGLADLSAPTDVTISDASLYIADPFHGRILQIRFGDEPQTP